LKLLFDQNLAPSLVRRLAAQFPGSAHVFDIGLGTARDRDVWDFARENGFAIVSKDSDFHQLSVWRGPPPKVIWVRLGNCSVDEVDEALRSRVRAIEQFDASAEAFLAIEAMP